MDLLHKLNSVLLVDDDDATKFLIKRTLVKSGCTNTIVEVKNGREAITYLTTKIEGHYPQPELIFLDINMPKMNGWEFLEEYKSLDSTQCGSIVIVMLTSSLNPDDRMRADGIIEVTDFESKPITPTKMESILHKNFPQLFSV